MYAHNEIWKPIPGFEGLYEVSSLGRVRPTHGRFKTATVLKPNVVRDYCRTTLYKNGERKQFQTHRLVALAFIPNPENKPHVNHIDGNKTNNNLANLEWVTRSENQLHAKRTGLDPTVRNNPIQSKAVEMFSMDGVFLKTFPSVKEAARQTGIGQPCISRCCSGKVDYKSAGGYLWRWKK